MYGETPKSGRIALAHREDFQLGNATIRPSLCTVAGPRGSVTVEPRVMEVLVTLVDAGGAVLSRDDLMQACWRGAIVGEDAVNRTIGEIRRAVHETGAGFGIETIKRVGYRLTGMGAGGAGAPAGNGDGAHAVETVPVAAQPSPADRQDEPRTATRRWLLVGGLVAAGAAAVALWPRRERAPDPHVDDVVGRAKRLLRTELKDPILAAIALLKAAVERDPTNAGIWGLLALAWAYAAEQEVAGAIDEAQAAASRAQQYDTDELDAEVALILVARGGPDDWYGTERRLREVLRQDKNHIAARLALASQLQSAGYSEESREWNDGTIKLEAKAGLQPDTLNRWAFSLWIGGEDSAALRAMDRRDKQYPDNQRLWRNHLVLRAFAGDFGAARTMVEKGPEGKGMRPEDTRPWLFALDALQTREPGTVAEAGKAIQASRMYYVQKTMILSELNLLGAAFDVLNAAMRYKEDKAVPAVPEAPSAHNPRWRQLQWLFTPATRNLRRDRRFAEVAEYLGLEDYWNQRGKQQAARGDPDEGRHCEKCPPGRDLRPQNPSRI